jgi:hypothetical protein
VTEATLTDAIASVNVVHLGQPEMETWELVLDADRPTNAARRLLPADDEW